MNVIRVILHKEWTEIRQQRGLMLGIILPTLLFALLPAVLMYVARLGGHVNLGSVTPSDLSKILGVAGLTQAETLQAMLGKQFSVLYLILPIILPSVIAAYSIVGEKTSHTLEPLLATPVHVWELLIGKSLIALLPSLIATWLCGMIFIITTALFALSGQVFWLVVSPAWLVVFLLWTPMLALIAIAVMVAISSRVNDPRTAQQVSAWAVIPFLALFYGQLFGLIVLGLTFALAVFVVLVALTALTFWIAARLFQREVILTSWK